MNKTKDQFVFNNTPCEVLDSSNAVLRSKQEAAEISGAGQRWLVLVSCVPDLVERPLGVDLYIL